MAEYQQLVLKLRSKVPRCDFRWVPRFENNHADSLSIVGAAAKFQFRCEIPVEHIANPSVHQPIEEILCLDTSPGWRDPIIAYLKDDPDKKAGAALASKYTLIGDATPHTYLLLVLEQNKEK